MAPVPSATPETESSGFAKRERSIVALIAVLALVAAFFLAFSAAEADAQEGESSGASEFVVIVHADNPIESVESKRLAKMFLKKLRRWNDLDESITPYDLDPQSEVREAFTRSVHSKSVSAIKSFWQRMLFSGRDVPPDELADDDAMIEAVGNDTGGLGYVSSGAELGDLVKAIDVVD